jgi:hypothetical protein
MKTTSISLIPEAAKKSLLKEGEPGNLSDYVITAIAALDLM